MRYGTWLMVLTTVIAAGCGTQPTSLLLGDGTGSLDVRVDGAVNTDLNVNVDTTVQGDVNCTIVCDLNTGECETVCELAPGTPPTPAELGAETYAANCAACHGDPPGTGFAPDLTGETADGILAEWANPSHPGGSFPNLTADDAANIAAFLAG